MADEIKKVISVDVGNTATTLKDYKKHIDELRGSLLQLDETSEDYAKIAQEIKNEQDKLNEVMKVGKNTTDAAEGSYNQLAQTMAELKKQWKATADQAERDELGKQILDINNQLKELDASTGNYQRNVGDYANAFETAFDKCLDGIKSIDGPLGELGGNVKNMVPIIKNINSTALAGLSGIKKGIAATGIGLLVIAIGELATHWKDFAELVGVGEKEITNFKTKAVESITNVIDYIIGFGNAFGNYLITPIKSGIEAFKGLSNIFKDVFSGNWSKIKKDAEDAFTSITNVFKKGFSFKANFEIGKEMGLGQKIVDIFTKEGEDAGKEATKAIKDGVSKESINTTKEISEAWSGIFKKALDIAINEVNEEAERRKNWLSENIQDAIDEANQLKFDFKYSGESDEMSDQERADREYEIERELIEKKIELQQTYIDAFIGTQEQKEAELKKLSKLQQELNNADLKHTKETEAKKASIRRTEQQNLLASSIALFGALSDLAEEGSEEQKAFSIMQTVLNTLQSIMGIWAGYSEMGPFGVAAAAIQTAAVSALGIATIAKMKATTKDSSGSASVAAPSMPNLEMTEVNPLLDEQADLNRLETSGLEGDSGKNQDSMRVYVVESDITNTQNRVRVLEDNATF